MDKVLQNKQKNILVVDDDPDVLESTRLILEDEGYTVATTTKSAYLETLQNGEMPDLVLLDVFLSGKDGREIVKHLKQNKATKHIPVVMFSAHPSAEETSRASGADDFLAKPFEIEDLLAKIEQFL